MQIGNCAAFSISPSRTGSAEGLLGHLHAIQLVVVGIQVVVERRLPLVRGADPGQDLGDPVTIGGFEPLGADGADVVENPDRERLAADARLGGVVDERPSLLEGDDPGM
jgi:hypothetical protein